MTSSQVDEERTPLIADDRHGEPASAQGPSNSANDEDSDTPKTSTFALIAVVPILLLGVFVASADGSLVIATGPHIASEFSALSNASWLVTSFMLAQCASQPLFGKLSDIFGRKSSLVSAYTLFTIGCFICGAARQFWHIILGRAVSGIGGAGMAALVSVIITDMVPVRDVARWRSYVNVSATAGRALGGPLGGWLTDSIGWRWSFYGQCPLTVVAIILVLWRLPNMSHSDDEHEDDTMSDKLRRIDSVGAIVLAGTISAFLLFTDLASKIGLLSTESISTFAAFVVGCWIFYIAETRWAKEPILPVHLITKSDALIPYLIAGCQLGAQFGAFYCYPIYFQISAGMSTAAAGSRLVPSVVGNATGGLLSGWIIGRTGRYKLVTTVGSCLACLAYLLVIIRFTGDTRWELAYTVGGGLGTGIIQSTAFVHLAAAFDHSEMAIVGTTLYLAMNLGLLIGINLATGVLHTRLAMDLRHDLKDIPHRGRIIHRSISNIDFIWRLPDQIKHIVVSAYVDSLRWSFGLSLALAFIGLVIGLFMKERKM